MKYGNVFITGANRGIGYEFVRQLIKSSHPPEIIFATYRSNNTILDLKVLQGSAQKTKLILIKMDVTHPEEVEVARQIVEKNVGDEGLHLLINNAGISQDRPIDQVTAETVENHFKTNTLGPMILCRALSPFLEKAASKQDGSKIVVLNMSSQLGSITETGNEFDLQVPSYKISKAALNMVMKVYATSVKSKGVLVLLMCPGWVKTDMGNKEIAELTPEESISAMLKTLDQISEKDHGTYVNRHGKPIPF